MPRGSLATVSRQGAQGYALPSRQLMGWIAGHPTNRGGLLSPKADLTHEYPNDARGMAQNTYQLLVEIGEQNPPLRVREAVALEQFHDQVEAFILADSKREKRAALKTLGVEMPDEFWEDVQLPERAKNTGGAKR
jgi:hypothetical protein